MTVIRDDNGAVKALLWFILIGLALRLAWFFVVGNWDPLTVEAKNLLGKDPGQYYRPAVELAQSGSLSSLHPARTPGYPAFLAFFFFLFGPSLWLISLAQIAISLVSGYLLYRLGGAVQFPGLACVFIAGFFILDPQIIFFSNGIMPECLFMFLLISFTLVWISGIRKHSAALFLVSGLLLGTATLVKPISLLYFIIPVVFLFAVRDFRFGFKAFSSLALIAGFLLLLLPWSYRNYVEHGFFNITTIGSSQLYATARLSEEAGHGANEEMVEVHELHKWGSVEGQGEKILYALNYIKDNFGSFISGYLNRVLHIFVNAGSKGFADRAGVESRMLKKDIRIEKGLLGPLQRFLEVKTPFEVAVFFTVNAYLAVGYLAALCGIYALIRSGNYFLLLFLLASAAYFTLLGGSSGVGRYRLPVALFYYPLSGIGFYQILKSFRSRSRTREAPHGQPA